jgi:hypothetical protein
MRAERFDGLSKLNPASRSIGRRAKIAMNDVVRAKIPATQSWDEQ